MAAPRTDQRQHPLRQRQQQGEDEGKLAEFWGHGCWPETGNGGWGIVRGKSKAIALRGGVLWQGMVRMALPIPYSLVLDSRVLGMRLRHRVLQFLGHVGFVVLGQYFGGDEAGAGHVAGGDHRLVVAEQRSEEHTSELQSLMRS